MEELLKCNRRRFLDLSMRSLIFAGLSGFPTELLAEREIRRLTVLHTNDTHSRIDPFPDNDPKFPGLGGVERRMQIIENIRRENDNVLLLDSGDFFQGTPYFNTFGGEVELKAMSAMHYNAATLGNHDFDNGIEGLVKQMPHATFPFLNANYNFENTLLHGKTEKFRIFEKAGIKVGVFGLGIALKGLVEEHLVKNIAYTEPVPSANTTAFHLKKNLNCDLVICLSHLGYKYETSKISDEILAMNTKNIDLILGGHTHTFLDHPVIVKNSEQKNTLIAQTGWGGIRMGRIDFLFGKKGQKISFNSSTVKISKKSI